MATLSTGQRCITPCSIKISRRSSFAATIKKDGYEVIQASIVSNTTSGGGFATAGNVLLGGLIGLAVDFATGASHAHTPNPLVVKLVPLQDDD